MEAYVWDIAYMENGAETHQLFLTEDRIITSATTFARCFINDKGGYSTLYPYFAFHINNPEVQEIDTLNRVDYNYYRALGNWVIITYSSSDPDVKPTVIASDDFVPSYRGARYIFNTPGGVQEYVCGRSYEQGGQRRPFWGGWQLIARVDEGITGVSIFYEEQAGSFYTLQKQGDGTFKVVSEIVPFS
jgi:hypothetical protein